MKLKELSLTDLITFVSAISVLVSIASQTYFYYRLDALWIMSFLTPSIYFIEVIRVMILFAILVFNVICIEQIFKWGLKCIVHKKKIRFFSNNDYLQVLTEAQKKYGNNLTVFLGIMIFVEWFLLNYFTNIFRVGILLWISAISGLILALLTDKEFDRTIRYVTLGMILLCVTALNAELKIVELDRAPYVYLKNDNDEKYRLMEVTQDKVIIFNVVDSNYQIQLMNTDQIKKIVAEVSPNQ